MDFFNIIWKRKWLIIIPTFLFMVAVGIYSYFQPHVWEIDAIIEPSKIFIKTEQGRFEEVVVVDPKQIAGQINKASYNNIIASELNLDIKKFPKLKAESLIDTNLVQVTLREQDVEKAKLILHTLFDYLKKQLDKKVNIEFKEIDSQVKSKEIEKLRIEEEIKANKNKLTIVKQRKEEIEKEMSDVKKRIEKLEEEQSLSLKKKNRSEAESMAMLLYSNEIQLSLRYYNTLYELLSQKKIEEVNINSEIENNENKISQIENEIISLNERKGRIDYAQFIKEPTSSPGPVAPRKRRNVLIAGIFGLILFTMFSFFLEHIEKQKVKG